MAKKPEFRPRLRQTPSGSWRCSVPDTPRSYFEAATPNEAVEGARRAWEDFQAFSADLDRRMREFVAKHSGDPS